MHANLVRTARRELGFEQAQRRGRMRPHLPSIENRAGSAPACMLDAHLAFARAGRDFDQRKLDAAFRVAPAALYQHEVALVGQAFAQRLARREFRRKIRSQDEHRQHEDDEPQPGQGAGDAVALMAHRIETEQRHQAEQRSPGFRTCRHESEHQDQAAGIHRPHE